MKKIYLSLISLLPLSVVFAQSPRFSYDYDANGNRTQRELIVMSSGGNKSAVYVDDSVGASVAQAEIAVIRKDDISIYPNPTKGHLKVEINSQVKVNNVIVDVYNMRGQSVYKNKDISGFYDIDLSSVTNGAYILSIRINESKYEWKIIKE